MELFELWPVQGIALKTLYEGLKNHRTLPDVLRRGNGYPDGLFEPGKWDNPDFEFSVDVPASVVDRVNRSFSQGYSRAKKYQPRMTYDTRTALLIIARLLTVALFWMYDLTVWQKVAIFTLQQLAICPLSIVTALAWAVTDGDFRIGHHLAFAPLTWLWYAAVPAEWADVLTLTIDGHFCIGYFLLDYLLCFYMAFYGKSSKNRSVVLPMKELLISIVWGTISSRTFPFIMCSIMYGAKVNFALILVDMVLATTLRASEALERITKVSPFVIQYHAHRMMHMPNLYDHGHRTHHGLLDNKMVSAFESSFAFGGIGMAEEFGPLMVDAGLHFLLGTQSNHFNFGTLISSWFVKVGHTEFTDDSSGDNLHLRHHLNGGIAFAMPWQDMVYGTAGTNSQYVGYGKRVTRERVTEGVKEPVIRIVMRKETEAETKERLACRAEGNTHHM